MFCRILKTVDMQFNVITFTHIFAWASKLQHTNTLHCCDTKIDPSSISIQIHLYFPVYCQFPSPKIIISSLLTWIRSSLLFCFIFLPKVWILKQKELSSEQKWLISLAGRFRSCSQTDARVGPWANTSITIRPRMDLVMYLWTQFSLGNLTMRNGLFWNMAK